MLSPEQRAEFDRLGLLRLPAVIPAAAVSLMRDRFWDHLSARHGIDRDRAETWTVEHPRHLQSLRRSGAFAAMASDGVRRALHDLLGPGCWQPPRAWGLPLVTFPVAGRGWHVPASGWHVDSHGPAHDLPGVTVFAFLTAVRARGGGTVLIPGSHHLVNRHIASTGEWRPADVKSALAARHRWLRDLWSHDDKPGRVARCLDEGTIIDGARFRVRELTGDPGDAILMHPRTLHAAAPNAAAEPRMMLVEIVARAPRAVAHKHHGRREP
jgi:hypothetical protein